MSPYDLLVYLLDPFVSVSVEDLCVCDRNSVPPFLFSLVVENLTTFMRPVLAERYSDVNFNLPNTRTISLIVSKLQRTVTKAMSSCRRAVISVQCSYWQAINLPRPARVFAVLRSKSFILSVQRNERLQPICAFVQ